MLNRFRFLIIGFALLLIAGCGQTVYEKTSLVPEAPYNAVGQGKTVAVLPFVDYSDSSYDTAIRRNIAISEAVMDQLSLNGFGFPVQEDVFKYLKEQGVILTDQKNVYMKAEMDSGEWSSEMQDYITDKVLKSSDNTASIGLSNREINKIGKAFQADYVLRGRIIEYDTRQDPSWNPIKRGFLSVLVEGTSRFLVGFADVDSYDGTTNFAMGDRTIGQVELRLWVQDAVTGDVVWTNHTNVEASPRTAYADPQHDAAFMASVKRNVCLLVHDFAKNGLK